MDATQIVLGTISILTIIYGFCCLYISLSSNKDNEEETKDNNHTKNN